MPCSVAWLRDGSDPLSRVAVLWPPAPSGPAPGAPVRLASLPIRSLTLFCFYFLSVNGSVAVRLTVWPARSPSNRLAAWGACFPFRGLLRLWALSSLLGSILLCSFSFSFSDDRFGPLITDYGSTPCPAFRAHRPAAPAFSCCSGLRVPPVSGGSCPLTYGSAVSFPRLQICLLLT